MAIDVFGPGPRRAPRRNYGDAARNMTARPGFYVAILLSLSAVSVYAAAAGISVRLARWSADAGIGQHQGHTALWLHSTRSYLAVVTIRDSRNESDQQLVEEVGEELPAGLHEWNNHNPSTGALIGPCLAIIVPSWVVIGMPLAAAAAIPSTRRLLRKRAHGFPLDNQTWTAPHLENGTKKKDRH
jgi:hypothetical protein